MPDYSSRGDGYFVRNGGRLDVMEIDRDDASQHVFQSGPPQDPRRDRTQQAHHQRQTWADAPAFGLTREQWARGEDWHTRQKASILSYIAGLKGPHAKRQAGWPRISPLQREYWELEEPSDAFVSDSAAADDEMEEDSSWDESDVEIIGCDEDPQRADAFPTENDARREGPTPPAAWIHGSQQPANAPVARPLLFSQPCAPRGSYVARAAEQSVLAVDRATVFRIAQSSAHELKQQIDAFYGAGTASVEHIAALIAENTWSFLRPRIFGAPSVPAPIMAAGTPLVGQFLVSINGFVKVQNEGQIAQYFKLEPPFSDHYASMIAELRQNYPKGSEEALEQKCTSALSAARDGVDGSPSWTPLIRFMVQYFGYLRDVDGDPEKYLETYKLLSELQA